MKRLNWVRTAEVAVAIVVGFCVALYVRGRVSLSTEIDSSWLDPVATLVATFLGAVLAFAFEALRERRSDQGRNMVEAQVVFFKLARSVNRVENLLRQYVGPAREDAARFLSIPAVLPMDPRDPTIDMDGLHFMFLKHANLLGEITILQDNYISLIALVNERSRFYLQVIQPKLKAAGLPPEFGATRAQLEALLGRGDLQELVNLTNQMVDGVTSLAPRLTGMANQFGEALEEYFPRLKLRLSLEQAA